MSIKNKWLIKSDYKVLGPYSYEQVEDLLMKKQVSLIDEIRDMNIRWSYVREVPEFKILVDTIREEIDQKSEMTQTIQTAFQRHGTQSGSHDEKNAENSKVSDSNAFTGIDLGPTIIDQIEVTNSARNNPLLRTTGILTKEKKDYSLKFKLIIIFIFILFVGSITTYYNINFSQNAKDKITFQQIRKAHLYQQDKKMIDLYKNLPSTSQDKILSDIISAWPILEQSGNLDFQRILDLASKGKINGNERKSQYQLYKFNKALSIGDMQNASDALVKAITLDPLSLEAKENDAQFYFLKKKHQESAQLYKSLYTQTNKGDYLFGYILNLYFTKSIESQAEQINLLIEKHLQSRVEFSKELLLIQLYIQKKYLHLNEDIFNKNFKYFLIFPNKLNQQLRRNALVRQELNNWSYLLDLKNELTLLLNPEIVQLLNVQFEIELSKFDLLTDEQKKEKQLASANILKNYNQLFQTWIQLQSLKYPEDKNQIKNLINNDRIYSSEFLPYLEYKAQLNE